MSIYRPPVRREYYRPRKRISTAQFPTSPVEYVEPTPMRVVRHR